MPVKLKGKKLSEYIAVHMWVYRHYGKAIKCENCKENKGYRFEWANISGKYKRDIIDWQQLCQSCHKKHDHGNKCKRGHPYEGNTLIRKDGNRQCKKCMIIANKKYISKNKNKKHAMD